LERSSPLGGGGTGGEDKGRGSGVDQTTRALNFSSGSERATFVRGYRGSKLLQRDLQGQKKTYISWEALIPKKGGGEKPGNEGSATEDFNPLRPSHVRQGTGEALCFFPAREVKESQKRRENFEN